MNAITKGWVNVHINVFTKEVCVSTKPYKTKKEAETGIYIGYGIEKVGCFEIEYTDVPTPPDTIKIVKKNLQN
jgi:hypothetical protein